MLLEIARTAARTDEIAQGAAAGGYGLVEDCLNGRCESLEAAQGDATRRLRRADAGAKQRFIGVYIANAGDPSPIH